MKTFNVPTRDQVSPASQTHLTTSTKQLEWFQISMLTMAYSENGLRRYLAFQGGKTSLNNKEKEAVNLVVSEVNGCHYCQSAHTVIGKMNGFTESDTLDLRVRREQESKT